MTPATPATPALDTWTDLSGFNQLRAQARGDDKAALPKVARQFEAIFTQMMLKSMREANASFGDNDVGDSEQGKAYRDLFDQQLSLSLSQGNNGLGIAPEYQTLIFEPFKRLHGPERPGSGIGLAVCKRIIERHQGKIWVESQVDHGSTFFFSIPK